VTALRRSFCSSAHQFANELLLVLEIIPGKQNHVILQPNEIPAAVYDIDLQLILRDRAGPSVLQEHIIVVILVFESIQSSSVRTIGPAPVQLD